MNYKRIIAVTAICATMGLVAFAPDIDVTLDHSIGDLPNQHDHERAADESRDGGHSSFRDDFGGDHDYIDGKEVV